MGSLAWIALNVLLYAVALLLCVLCARQVVLRYPNLGYRVRCCICRSRVFVTKEGVTMTVRQALLNAKEFSSRRLMTESCQQCNITGPEDKDLSLLPACGHLFHATCINGFQSVCRACPTCHAIDYAPIRQLSRMDQIRARIMPRARQNAGPKKAGCSPEQAACPSEQPRACPSEQPAACPSEQQAACPSEQQAACPSEQPAACPLEQGAACPSEQQAACPSKSKEA